MNLDISEDDLKFISIVAVERSDSSLNAAGEPHQEITGKFVRQTDMAQIWPILRSVVLDEIAAFVRQHAKGERNVLSVRIWPEGDVGGINQCYAKWYARLSVYSVASAK